MKYDLIKNTFKQSNASAYQLSILFGMDSLIYSVTDIGTQELLVLKNVSMPLATGAPQWAEALRKENLLDLLYRRVKVALVYPQSTLVPARLFNEASKTAYLNEISMGTFEEPVQDDHAETLGCRVIYPPKSAIGTMLSQRFPTAKFYNGLTAFLHGCAEQAKMENGYSGYAHFFDSCFYFSLFEKDRLLFCNTFSYQTAADVMYFILLAFEQYGASTDEAKLYLTGKILENSDIYNLLLRYVRHIDFLPPPSFVNMDEKFATIPSHLFFPLHAMNLL